MSCDGVVVYIHNTDLLAYYEHVFFFSRCDVHSAAITDAYVTIKDDKATITDASVEVACILQTSNCLISGGFSCCSVYSGVIRDAYAVKLSRIGLLYRVYIFVVYIARARIAQRLLRHSYEVEVVGSNPTTSRLIFYSQFGRTFVAKSYEQVWSCRAARLVY